MKSLEQEIVKAEANLVAKLQMIKQESGDNFRHREFFDRVRHYIEKTKRLDSYKKRRSLFKSEYKIVTRDIEYSTDV